MKAFKKIEHDKIIRIVALVLIVSFILAGLFTPFSLIMIFISVSLIWWGFIIRDKDNRIGTYLTPFQTVIFKFGLSILIGQILVIILATFVYIFSWFLNQDLYLWWQDAQIAKWLMYPLLGIAFTYPFAKNDETPIKIPANHCGVLTFLDKRYDLFLTEGSYKWYGKRLYLGIFSDSLYGSKNIGKIGEEQGFPYLGKRNLQVFDKAAKRDDGKPNNIELSNITKNKSTVTTNLTLVIRTVDPMQWMLSDDAILRICEKARSAFRIAISNFIDTDCTAMKSALQSLIMGKTIITVFVTNADKGFAEGEILKDMSGTPQYDEFSSTEALEKFIKEKNISEKIELTENDFSDEEKAEAIKEALGIAINEFKEKIDGLLSGKQRDAISTNGKYDISAISLTDTEGLMPVVQQTGAILEGIMVSDAHLKDVVSEAYDQYSAERGHRLAQVMSAETNKLARKLLALEPGEDETARLLAAQNDGNNNVHIQHTSSGSELITAASIIANSTKKEK